MTLTLIHSSSAIGPHVDAFAACLHLLLSRLSSISVRSFVAVTVFLRNGRGLTVTLRSPVLAIRELALVTY